MADKGGRLSAEACRDAAVLRAFVERTVSVNAWPIYSRPLRKLIRSRGLELAAARDLRRSLPELAALMERMYASSRRVERSLGIDNAFHHTTHSFEVLLRLLLLEWPPGHPLPRQLRSAAERVHASFEEIRPVLLELMRRMLELGVPSWQLARDLLAALGHDYGHSGGPERRDASGALAPLTHEETAERHVAKLGIRLGLPPVLILESLAGIRATTVQVRPGRRRIRAATEFERRLTLADVAGWVLPADRWLTHVSLPLFKEKIQAWNRRRSEIPEEIDRLRRKIAALPRDAGRRRRDTERLAALEAEGRAMAEIWQWDLDLFFRGELGFLSFARADRLEAVPAGRELWGKTLDRKIALIERVLARDELIAPLKARGFALLEELTEELAGVESLASWLGRDGVDPCLRELLGEFLG